MTSTREQGRVFGEVAEAYDDVRLGYPAEITEWITAYAGRTPASVVESGAGTGKGTLALRALGVPISCVEPDPAMAAVLARRFADDELVAVTVSRFEDWTPPAGGVELLASAQAWHWVDRRQRTELAARALAAGGVIALFGHEHGFDDETAEAVDAVYLRIAPEIAHGGVRHADVFHPDELRDSPLFSDVREERTTFVVPFSTERYLALLSTFSNHRMLPEALRAELHAALAAFIDERGGVLEQRVTTTMVLARR
jgi:SAM-dependent methyltransferase